ncbi:MAG TPA: 2Fe-2S iron-sulfur cluster-binding protein [Intrasporangium sp.]|nr:2Fe-2S iron-sulfur cluster-binding protein [Intrasporangium sp.]
MNEEPNQLTVQPDDVSIIVRPGETVLQAMHAAGLGYRTGCRRGGCGVCKVDLVEGTVGYSKVISESVMSHDEFADGTCLTCHAVPTSDVTIALRDERLRIKVAALLALRKPC